MCCSCVSSPSLSPSLTYFQDEYAPTTISVLKHFGLGSLADELLADGVHNLGNLLSLSADIHGEFYDLNLWFEATEVVCYY